MSKEGQAMKRQQMKGYNFHTMPLDEHMESNFKIKRLQLSYKQSRQETSNGTTFDQDQALISGNFTK